MNIGAMPPTGASVRVSVKSPAASTDRLDGWGPLLASDVALIQAATNTKFNWPPIEGQGFPEAAFDLSVMRARQAAENVPMKALTANDLSTLRNAGIIDEQFFTKSIDYLKTGGRTDGSLSVIDLTVPRSATRIAPGTVAPDGSIYM